MKHLDIEYLTLHELTFRVCQMEPWQWDDVEFYFEDRKGFDRVKDILMVYLGIYYQIRSNFDSKYLREANYFSGKTPNEKRSQYGFVLSYFVRVINAKYLKAFHKENEKWLPIISEADRHVILVPRNDFLNFIRCCNEGFYIKNLYCGTLFWGPIYENGKFDHALKSPSSDSGAEIQKTKESYQRDHFMPQLEDAEHGASKERVEELILPKILCRFKSVQEIEFYYQGKMITCTPSTLGYKNEITTKKVLWQVLIEIVEKKAFEVGIQSKTNPDADARRKQLENLEIKLKALFSNSFSLEIPDSVSLFEGARHERGIKRPLFFIES